MRILVPNSQLNLIEKGYIKSVLAPMKYVDKIERGDVIELHDKEDACEHATKIVSKDIYNSVRDAVLSNFHKLHFSETNMSVRRLVKILSERNGIEKNSACLVITFT